MIDHSQGFRIFGCNHDSAGIPVNSVAESRSKRILFLRTPFTFYGEIGLDVRNQSVIVPGSVTVTKNTRFFIDKKQVGILINNAGIAQQKLFTELTQDDWKAMLGTDLDGVFNCTQEALKRFMLPNHQGVILNISSMWGQVGASCEAHYSAAKAGVIGLTKALAKELGLSNIRVNCIAPGVVMTDMMKDFDDRTIRDLKEETPLNVLGTPKDIADAAVFLCSDRAKFITGQVLGVNGGYII